MGQRFNTKNFPLGKILTKTDYVIIVGDFGLIWANDNEDKYWLKWLSGKPWTTLFIDGNHENFKLDKFWWTREMPSVEEYEEGLQCLVKNDWKVDYVLTHTCSYDALKTLSLCYGLNHVEADQMHMYFNEIKFKLAYKKWFFGHFHKNIELPDNQCLLYNNIVMID